MDDDDELDEGKKGLTGQKAFTRQEKNVYNKVAKEIEEDHTGLYGNRSYRKHER